MLREATPDDARVLAELQVRTWRAAYRGILPAQLLDDLSLAHREAQWGSAVDNAGSRTLLWEDEDGALAGFCSVTAPSRDDDAGERTAEITAVYVDPSHWGQGTGRELLTDQLVHLKGAGWREVTLWTFLRNAQGRAFFARCGFRLDGAQGTHEASGSTTARMRTRL